MLYASLPCARAYSRNWLNMKTKNVSRTRGFAGPNQVQRNYLVRFSAGMMQVSSLR